MTKQELAQKIKAKYPQYQSIEDNELADRIIAKYPVYQNQITEQPKKQSMFMETLDDFKQTGSALKNTYQKTQDKISNIASAEVAGEQGKLRSFGQTLGTVAGGISHSIGDVLTGAIKSVLPQAGEDAVKKGIEVIIQESAPILTQLDKALGRPVGTTIDAYNNLPEQSKRDVNALLGISEFAFDIAGAGVAKKAGKKAIDTGVDVTKKVAQKTGTTLKSAATNIKPAVGRALSTTGAIGEKTGKSLVSASLSPTMEQAGRIITYKSKTPLLTRLQQASKGIEKAPITPADVAIKYDLASLSRSQIGIKAKRVANDLFENQVKPALSSIKEKVSKQELFNSVKKEIEKIKDISTRKAQLNALESLADDYKNVSSWSYKTLDTIKSEMAKRLPSKVWKGQDIAGDLNNVRRILSDKARNVIRKKLPKEITTIYDEYGSLKELSERGAKALTSGLNTNLIGLTGEAMRIATTPITTLGGSAISKAGTAVRKLGNKLLKSKPLPKGKGEILKSKPLKSKTPTNPLIQEAKKYKSAEEFVNDYADTAVPRSIIRENILPKISQADKTNSTIKIGKVGDLIKDERVRKELGYGLNIDVYAVGEKIAKEGGFRAKFINDDLAGLRILLSPKMQNVNETIIHETLHGLRALKGKTGKLLEETADIGGKNISKLVKTKSQLTEIWNKANKNKKLK